MDNVYVIQIDTVGAYLTTVDIAVSTDGSDDTTKSILTQTLCGAYFFS